MPSVDMRWQDTYQRTVTCCFVEETFISDGQSELTAQLVVVEVEVLQSAQVPKLRRNSTCTRNAEANTSSAKEKMYTFPGFYTTYAVGEYRCSRSRIFAVPR